MRKQCNYEPSTPSELLDEVNDFVDDVDNLVICWLDKDGEVYTSWSDMPVSTLALIEHTLHGSVTKVVMEDEYVDD